MLRVKPDESTPLIEQARPAEFIIDMEKIREDFKHAKILDAEIDKLAQISRKQKYRYIPLAVGTTLDLSVIAVFIYLMKKFHDLPSLLPPHTIPPDFMANYINTTILDKTCGELNPLDDICDFTKYTQLPNWVCSEVARSLCEPQTVIKTFTVDIMSGSNATCAQLYPLVVDNYCNWHSIVGYAHECLWKARSMCQDSYAGSSDMSEIVKQYMNTTLAEAVYCPDIPALSNVTCGELLPLENVCNWPEVVNTVAYRCADIANNICASTYTTMLQEYNKPLPDIGYSCQNKFPLDDYCSWPTLIGKTYNCSLAAESECAAKNSWKDPNYPYNGPEWWSDSRVLILLGSIAAFLVLLGVGMCICCGTRCIKSRRKVSDLTDTDKQALKEVGTAIHITIEDQAPISGSLNQLERKQQQIIDNKKLITEMRHTLMFARHPKNAGTPLNAFLNADGNLDVTRRILWYADLWPEEPERQEHEHAQRKTCAIL